MNEYSKFHCSSATSSVCCLLQSIACNMGAVIGLHDSVVHVVEGDGLVMINALVLVVSHATLVWTADVTYCMFDPCNCNRIDEDYAMFGGPQSIPPPPTRLALMVQQQHH
jgi:hypothetical protein